MTNILLLTRFGTWCFVFGGEQRSYPPRIKLINIGVQLASALVHSHQCITTIHPVLRDAHLYPPSTVYLLLRPPAYSFHFVVSLVRPLLLWFPRWLVFSALYLLAYCIWKFILDNSRRPWLQQWKPSRLYYGDDEFNHCGSRRRRVWRDKTKIS